MNAVTNSQSAINAAADVATFLAHALELESEAARRYEELADSLATHNQPEIAKMFTELAGYAKLHRDEVRGIAAKFGPLPKIAPWEFDWAEHDDSPEAAAWEDTHYLMTPHHALKAALKSEAQSRDYYAAIAKASQDPEVRRMAAEFAEEETGHVAVVERWLTHHPAPDDGWDDDPDPPNISD